MDWIVTLTTLYQKDRKAMVTYARMVTGSVEMAEDAVHDAYTKLVKTTLRPERVRAYVFATIRNAALDLRNSTKRQPFDADMSLTPTQTHHPIGVEMEQQETEHRLRQSIAALDLNQREVVMLRLQTDFTFDEIAKILNKPAGTVATHYRRGLEQLKTMLEVTT